jgi:hypothetical protein
MSKQRIILIIVILLGISSAFFAHYYRLSKYDDPTSVTSKGGVQNNNQEPVMEVTEPEKPDKVNLSVPFTVESPEGSWKGPWVNACEEASITMVEKFYKGQETITPLEAQTFMETLFVYQNKKWGSNADSDAARTVDIINNATSYKGTIKVNPTLEEIKEELRNGRPVISLHYGFGLNNPGIRFLATGSSYHMMVIKGYDDTVDSFITNDNGDRVAGHDHMYDYDLFLDSIHDFDFKTRKANGPPTVIFTSKS